MNATNELKIGSKVVFGRTNGEQTKGEVVKINQKTLKIRQTETRSKHPIGTVWSVPHSLVRLDNGKAPRITRTSPSVSTLRKGDKVKFCEPNGPIREGFVKRVNAKTISVQPNEQDSYSYWRVPHHLIITETA